MTWGPRSHPRTNPQQAARDQGPPTGLPIPSRRPMGTSLPRRVGTRAGPPTVVGAMWSGAARGKKLSIASFGRDLIIDGPQLGRAYAQGDRCIDRARSHVLPMRCADRWASRSGCIHGFCPRRRDTYEHGPSNGSLAIAELSSSLLSRRALVGYAAASDTGRLSACD